MKHNTNNSPTVVTRWMRFLEAVVILALMMPAFAVSQKSHFKNPVAVPLSTAGSFRLMAPTITVMAGDTVTGNVGGTSVTNSGRVNGDIWATTPAGGGTLSGTLHDNTDGIVAAAQADLVAAYDTAVARVADTTLSVALDGDTLGRGVYASGTFSLNDTLVLTGTASDVFIFKATGTTLITGTAGYVKLINGAVWSNVFWQVTSSATIAGDFKGVVLALVSIDQSADPASIINGRLLAQNGAVTVNGHKVLPVELVSFIATANRASANLRWSTATETNNYGFEIERRQSGIWEKIGFVAGAGASSSPRSYSYTDKNLSEGSYAYRIKQVNKDASFSYYGSAQVHIGSVAKKFELASNYPNPFNPSTTVQFTLENDGVATLIVYNVLGQEVMTLFNDNAQAGKLYQVKFDASRLPTGLYFAKLQSGNQRMMQKMALVK